MKILSAIVAILLVTAVVLYTTNTSVASTASITYISPTGSLSQAPSVYVFSATSGSSFDVQLSTSDQFGTLLENLSNQTDANIFTPEIEVNSSVMSSLDPGTYYWRVRENGGSFVDGNATFTLTR